jgi:DNA helicase HerA-like ATPase
MTPPQPLATVIQGSLSRGLEARLNPGVSVEDLRVGKFVVIQGQRNRFFGLLTDVTLETSNPQILVNPPRPEETLLQEVLAGTGTYGIIALTPMLMLVPRQTEGERLYPLVNPERPEALAAPLGQEPPSAGAMELLPVKTVPAHFSQVYEARELDFRTVFGWEDDPERRNFAIGQPLDMAVPICLDLDRWVERSNGIFGKSGTGKSFLARLILAGIIRKRAAVNLIFDMHSEYGWEAASEDKHASTVKGLRQLFPGQVQIYTLDPDSTRRRGVRDAQELFIAYNQIEVEDLALLAEELNLSEASLENAIILRNEFGRDWISRLLSLSNTEIQEFCEQKMGNKASMMALQRKLTRLDNLKYIRSTLPHNYIGQILDALSRGIHVVIEFGSQSNLLSYMLAANVITRRISPGPTCTRRSGTCNPKIPSTGPPSNCASPSRRPTAFWIRGRPSRPSSAPLPREMRKYFVTLLVVDQRPSRIDSEVMSQLGTRITALLNDDQDIEAVFTGVAGSQNLRTVLAKLDSKQQALLLGHAVPMPVVVQTRPYDQRFYAEIADPDWSQAEDAEVLLAAQQAKSELGL